MPVLRSSGANVAPSDPLRLAHAQCAAGRAAALALRWLELGGGRHDFTYGQLADKADRCARLLVKLGLTPGDTVAVMTGRQPETVIAALGIWRAGGVYCPIFADLGPEPLRARLALGDVRMLVVGAEVYRRVVSPVRGFLPKLCDVLIVGDAIPIGCEDFRGGLDGAAAGDLPDFLAADRPAMAHFTGPAGP